VGTEGKRAGQSLLKVHYWLYGGQGSPSPLQQTLFLLGFWWAVSDLNAGPSGCKPDALTAELTARLFNMNGLQHILKWKMGSMRSN
jgi:hypothetical protein